MASIKLGPNISDIRGSIDGTTYARNRSGLYARARKKPVDPMTARQVLQRNRVALAANAYLNDLTDAQRALWFSLADAAKGINALGDSVPWTAQNWFIRINTLRLLAGQALLTTPPAYPATVDCPVQTIAGTVAGGIVVSASVPEGAAGDTWIWLISRPLPITRNFWRGPWATVYTATGALTPPVTIQAADGIAIGDRFFILYRFLEADGHISKPQLRIIDVSA